MPCAPGTFSAQIGMLLCTQCPRGFICPGFGRVAPAICPPGYVCSKSGLRSPNLRCPAGYYCPNGTVTVDPFRNDTTLRPYACTAGTFCLAGTGFNSVLAGNFSYAQPCTEGFYCESASNSPRGSGLCPPGFICPLKTSVPKPAPAGSYAELEGTIQQASCLPGYYAPTIETVSCYPCPPGTSCETEGMVIADICPPGTYRSTIDEVGVSCVACPQGYWSKNYGLREKGECVKCAPGMNCAVEGMTTPCSHSDLPSSFEPVVNYQGSPDFAYNYPDYNMPASYSQVDCLNLNDGYTEGTMDPFYQEFFYGELIPPYIDVLGRSPYLRSSDAFSMKYQVAVGCYKNSQPYGSPLYQRLVENLGPQYDIQTGHDHQGYSLINPSGSQYYDGFWAPGSLYIDLPHARKFEPSYNCTKGIRLMNETRVLYNSVGVSTTVYTIATFDPSGQQRTIPKGEDQFYPGTCEADVICYSAVYISSTSQALPCSEGYICDEVTSGDNSNHFLCRAGYYCDFGTTPDSNLLATMGQFRKLCPPGYYCKDGTGRGQAYNNLCPVGKYFEFDRAW
jgi:hypothetical protein